RRHGGAWQRRAFFDRQVSGNLDDAFFLQHHVFGEHAVDAAAERRGMRIRPRLAGRPALEETAGYLVAGLDARDAGADLDHFAGAVRKRDEIFPHRCAIGAADDAEVAEIQRARDDFDQYLAMQRLRQWPIDFDKGVDTRATLGQLICTHAFAPGIEKLFDRRHAHADIDPLAARSDYHAIHRRDIGIVAAERQHD